MATAAKAAKHICLSVSRFRDLVDEGVFERRPSGQYSLDVIREAYCLHAQKVMQGRGADHGAALSTQRARLAEAQTAAAEIKNAVSRGEFVSLSAMQRIAENHYSVVRERVLSTPGKSADRLTSYCAEDRGRIMEILTEEARDALTDLSTDSFMDAKLSEARARARPDAEVDDIELVP
jgi:phage terminase Nu1 subunit (DNA packaging protein)